MSYILDALRKAERDRNLGRTPSLGDVTANAPSKPSRRPSPRTFGLIALVAVLLICTLWLWPRSPAPAPVAPAPPVAATPPVPAPPPVAESVAPTPPASPAPTDIAAAPAERTLAPEVPAESIDDLMGDVEGPEPSVGEAQMQVAPAARAPATEAPEPAPAAMPEDVPAAEEEQSEPEAIDEAAVASDAPLLRDMPSDYRGAFPSLRVDVHVYDDDPARRWVMVNGRKAVEGATLGEGPTVSRITPEGIVFDFRGSSVLFPLNR